MSDDTVITDLVGRVRKGAEGDKVSVGQIAEALGQDSLPPNLMIPAFAVASPLSGVPLFSSICGLLIALVSAQMLIGRDHVWLPGFLMRRHCPATGCARRWTGWRSPRGSWTGSATSG